MLGDHNPAEGRRERERAAARSASSSSSPPRFRAASLPTTAVSLLLPLLSTTALTALPLLLPLHNGLALSQLPFLLHIVACAAAVTMFLWPMMQVLAPKLGSAEAISRERADTMPAVLGTALPAAAYGLFVLIPCLAFMAANKWERPVPALVIMAEATGFFYVPLPIALAFWLQRRRRYDGRTEAARRDERKFVIATVSVFVLCVLFFLAAFLFLSVFTATRRTAIWQAVALTIYQIVAHLIFKKVLGPLALRQLAEEQRLEAYPAIVCIFEAIAELFLAFSFPSVQSPIILMLAVANETILFVHSVRRLLWGKTDKVAPQQDAPRPLVRSSSGHESATTDDSERQANDVLGGIGQIYYYDADDEDEAAAYHVGGAALVNVRRATAFGVLFIFEWLSAIAFTMSFATMCFGPMRRSYGFGSLPNGECTSNEYAVPVFVAVGTAALHTFVFVVINRVIKLRWRINSWALGVNWIRCHNILVGTFFPVALSQLAALLLAQYDVSGYAAVVLAGNL